MKKQPLIEFKQLKYFIHVAEFGSFSKAADYLDIAQPILSRQVRSLEVKLESNLLVRNGRGVTVTESGKIFLEHCRGISHQVELAYDAVHSDNLSGRVVLGLPPTAAKMLSLPITRTVFERLPDASLVIKDGLTSFIGEGILTGKLDMGLVYNPELLSGLELNLLYEDRLCLIAPIDHTNLSIKNDGLDLVDIVDLPLILPCMPNPYRILVENELAKIHRRANVILEIDSVSLILDMVHAKLGYAVLSESSLCLSAHAEQLVSYPIRSPELINKLFIAISSKRKMTKTQQKLYAIILEVIGGLPKRI